jgi:hypothetical protein
VSAKGAAVVSALVRGHRVLFVAATALVGVAASEVAARSGATRYWLLLAGSALLMLTGDTFSTIEGRARVLSTGSSVPIAEARKDLFGQTRPRLLSAFMISGVLLVGAGFIVPLPAAHPISASRRLERFDCAVRQHSRRLETTFRCTLSP